jgi:hypothetical protein
MFSGDVSFNPFAKTNDGYEQLTQGLGKKFLDSFEHKHHTFCYNGNPRKKISSMNHTHSLNESYSANRDNGADVYFYVNGARKVYDIKEFGCCFCDMDAGRDENGSYFKPSVVMEKKKEFLKKINEFPVAPSWVVDTRNGYQCYWLLDHTSRKIVGKNKTFWNGLQKKLVNYFGGDPRAIRANQIYRVPYTWWRKGWENKASYMTSILPGSTGNKVSVLDLKSALTGQPATLNIIPEHCSDEWYKGYAKAYKAADENGVPVSANIAQEILKDMKIDARNVQTVMMESIMNTNPVVSSGFIPTKCCNTNVPSNTDELDETETDGVTGVLSEMDALDDTDLNPDTQQTFLLKKVVEFLNQASTPLYFSKNQFLSRCAKELANEISDKFCIG